MPAVLPPHAVRAWFAAAERELRAGQRRIDDINVFPVCDHDTGTNVVLTWQGAVRALARQRPDASGLELAQAAARGAFGAARGNSGSIVAQCLLGALSALRDPAPGTAGWLVSALVGAAGAARLAVDVVEDGTMVTVIEAAARAAMKRHDEDPQVPVARLAQEVSSAAHAALLETRERHPVLRAAHVVDAGGCAVVVVLDALGDVVGGSAEMRAATWLPHAGPVETATDTSDQFDEFEIMFRSHASGDGAARLRHDLAQVGDSLVVAGEPGRWHGHVHTRDVGAVIGAVRAAEAGDYLQMVIRPVFDAAARPGESNAVVITRATGLAPSYAQAGVVVILCGREVPPWRRVARVMEGTAGADLVVMTAEPDLAVAARRALHEWGGVWIGEQPGSGRVVDVVQAAGEPGLLVAVTGESWRGGAAAARAACEAVRCDAVSLGHAARACEEDGSKMRVPDLNAAVARLADGAHQLVVLTGAQVGGGGHLDKDLAEVSGGVPVVVLEAGQAQPYAWVGAW